ncbi:carboxyltransferase domain-containing protein, partial [Pseudomonas syringae]
MTLQQLPPRITLLGTTALLFEAPGELELAAQQRIWALASLSKDWPQVRESVSGMNNLMLTFAAPPRDLTGLKTRLLEAWEQCQPLPLQGRIIEL